MFPLPSAKANEQNRNPLIFCNAATGNTRANIMANFPTQKAMTLLLPQWERDWNSLSFCTAKDPLEHCNFYTTYQNESASFTWRCQSDCSVPDSIATFSTLEKKRFCHLQIWVHEFAHVILSSLTWNEKEKANEDVSLIGHIWNLKLDVFMTTPLSWTISETPVQCIPPTNCMKTCSQEPGLISQQVDKVHLQLFRDP